VQSQRVPGGHVEVEPEEALVETPAALQAFFGEPGAQDVGNDQHMSRIRLPGAVWTASRLCVDRQQRRSPYQRYDARSDPFEVRSFMVIPTGSCGHCLYQWLDLLHGLRRCLFQAKGTDCR
jgi:hypothetical protein